MRHKKSRGITAAAVHLASQLDDSATRLTFQSSQDLKFVIPGQPTSWARPRAHGKIHFTPAKQRAAANFVRTLAATAFRGRSPMTGPLSVSVLCVWEWPTSMSLAKRRLPQAHWKATRPDADNAAKLILDSLNGLVFHDDGQVADLRVAKQFGMEAKTLVSITPLLMEESVD